MATVALCQKPARYLKKEPDAAYLRQSLQEHYIGRHLRDCACSTEDAREMLRNIVNSMETRS